MSGGSGSARSEEDESAVTASTDVAERPKRAPSAPDPFAETRLADSDPGAFDTDRIAPSLPTALFERYKIKRKLGAGGMGVVYEALDQNLHRVVALKVLKLSDEDPTQLAEAANRLVREARAKAVLSHKNVVTVYDVGIHGMQVYVAMQLVDGTTLRKWLEAAPRTSSQILRVLCDAGAGLAAAHGARLIHRDFKPDNVLVSRRGSVRVTDFGLARRANFDGDTNTAERTSRPKVLDPAHSVDNVTRSGAILGTPAYMPPEQSEGRPCDARADQFSFCVTAWEALYGVRPFAGKTWSELYSNVVAGNVIEPDSKSRVPRAIGKALRRGMSVEPGDRFATMSELLEVLETGIERDKSWLRYIAIPLVSAGLAAGIAYFVTRGSSSPAPRAAIAPPAGSAQSPAAPPAVGPTPPVTVEPIPIEAPHIVPSPTVPESVLDAEEAASAGKKKRRGDRHKKPDAAAHVETTTDSTTDATAKPPVDEVPAPQAPDPADAVRARRKSIETTMRERGLRSGDAPAASAALAQAETALAANDLPAADKALGDAEKAIAAIVIDYDFINAKLSRINKRLQQSAGREEEFRALLKQLMELMSNKQFAAANKLLNDISDRLAKK